MAISEEIPPEETIEDSESLLEHGAYDYGENSKELLMVSE